MEASTIYPHWYVVQSKPREERRALENLQRQGFECYFPQVRVEKARHGRKVKLPEPLFPGYLFIRLDEANDNWYPIRSTAGVLRLVTFNSNPLPVDGHMIHLIRLRLSMEKPTQPYFLLGDPVRITEGPFAQLEAMFVANEGEDRVVLLMNILSREQRLTFPITLIQKAGVS